MFQPPRSSTPTSATTELASLSPSDVQVIDSIIERAGPTASSFLPVFKAYNDIMRERGTQETEVKYYAKVLALGTLKGATWGEKWRSVKQKHGYNTLGLEFEQEPVPPPYRPPSIVTAPSKPPPPTKSLPPSKLPPQVVDDAWKKIRMTRDEEDADRFRESRLVERFWNIWKVVFDWSVTTTKQLVDARNDIVLRQYTHRWLQKTRAKLKLQTEIGVIADRELLRLAFVTWHTRMRISYQNRWREGMRARMEIVRARRMRQMIHIAWVNWRTAYTLRMANHHYDQSLLIKFHDRWKHALSKVERMEEISVQAAKGYDSRLREEAWNLWRNSANLRSKEGVLRDRVAIRVQREVVRTWKKQMYVLGLKMFIV